MKSASLSDILLWLLLALIWSSSFAAIKVAVGGMEPTLVVVVRLWFGTAVLLAALAVTGRRLAIDAAALRHYLVSGFLGSTFPFLLITHAEVHVDSALAAILMGVAPVVSVLLAGLVFADEPVTLRRLVGLTLGVGGVVLLVGADALAGLGRDVLAQLAILVAAISYGAVVIYVRAFVTLPPLSMAAGSTLVAALMATLAAPFMGAPMPAAWPATSSILAVLYLGAFPTAIAALIYFRLVARLGAARLSQINFAVPALGAVIGAVWLAESLGPRRLLAIAVISTAILLVTRQKAAAARAAVGVS